MTHVHLPTSDHCGLCLRVNNGNETPRRNYFKFLGAWLDHADFDNQVKHSWCISSTWIENMQRLSLNLKDWNRDVFGHIFKWKNRFLKRLEGINRVLMSSSNERLANLKNDL